MVLSNYKDKNAKLILKNNEQFQVTPLSQYRSKKVNENQKFIFVKKLDNNDWQILDILEVPSGEHAVTEVVSLPEMWKRMMGYWSDGTSANSIEIFVSRQGKKEISKSQINSIVEIDFKALPGVYLFPKESLQKVNVKKNNRAILLPTEKVKELMDRAVLNRNFTYLPNWFTAYATNRSVDLYLVQRAEYDRLNSAARN
jgi:hypothetical protein